MTPIRTSYWHISNVWLFYILAGLAVALFGVGLYRHLVLWQKGARSQGLKFSLNREAILRLVLDGFLGRRIFRGDPWAGLMHLFIFWGFSALFIGTVLISADYWIYPFLNGNVYLGYAFCLEIAGLMLGLGLLWALVRRYVQRVSRLERRPEDLLIPVLLLMAVLSGFLLEGSRLAAQAPFWADWSFIGNWLRFLWPDSTSALQIYPFFWWLHAVICLGLIALIPFTKLFHLLATPASLYWKGGPLRVLPAEEQGTEVFTLADMLVMDACTRCGRCVEVCPVTGTDPAFSPRAFIRAARAGLCQKYASRTESRHLSKWLSMGGGGDTEFTSGQIWQCTTCRACLEVCPVYVAVPDTIRQARREVVEAGTDMPPLLAQSLKNVYKYNNPWEATKKKRNKWAADLSIPDLTREEQPDTLCYWVGCTTAMDSRAQQIARAFVRILEYGNVPFGTLGKKEPCCGDIARRAGEDGLFEMKRDDTTDILARYEIRDLVTSSPHCFHTLKNEYPAYGALREHSDAVRVRHYSQVLEKLLDRGALVFENRIEQRITYHDPCYLGRHNRIFDSPRKILRAIPGLELVEMAHNRADSLCCGGGGDRIWQEDMEKGPKMSGIRIQEAAETGAEILVTACPLCLIMLEDARKAAGLTDRIQVLDLNELVATALSL